MTKLQLSLLLIALFIAIANFYTVSAAKLTDTQAQGLFVEFMKRYGKSYAVDNFFQRFDTFRDNVQWIIDWNDNKSNTHQVGVNFFADMTPDEWTSYKGLIVPSTWSEPDLVKFDNMKDEDDVLLQQIRQLRTGDAPLSHSWVEKGIMLPIRDQKSCGSCYSFSAVACIEALHKINFPDEDLGYLSTQQGVDCTGSKYGCSYCQGGWMTSVFDYLIDNKGICSEESYPYKNRRSTCADRSCEKVFSFQKYRDISGSKESTILEHLLVNPEAIAVTSNTREFMYYKSGVITNCGGSRSQAIDHAVVAVGYDKSSDNGQVPHVLIRNSWSANWGDKGHVKLAIGNNVCKWRSNVSYPILTQPQQQ